jgi:hypothetical protein
MKIERLSFEFHGPVASPLTYWKYMPPFMR